MKLINSLDVGERERISRSAADGERVLRLSINGVSVIR